MNKDERLLIAIDKELKSRLRAAAEYDGVTMSEMIRRLIAQIPVIGRIDDERVIWGNDSERE